MTPSRPHPSRRLAALLTSLGLALTALVATGPAHATPTGPGIARTLRATTTPALAVPTRPAARPRTIAGVMAELDRLAQSAEVLTERFNGLGVQLAAERRKLEDARRVQQTADASYAAAHRAFVNLVQAQYEGDRSGSVGAMLTSANQADYLGGLATQALVARHSTEVLHRVGSTRAQAERARASADRALAASQARKQALAAQRAKVTAQTKDFQKLLASLNAAQIRKYASRGAPTAAEITRALGTPAPNKSARKAVQFAVEQVGKPYVFGAVGPDTWDCSGLTMGAWAAAGVHLPHFSASQFLRGHHVGYDQLQPGDLVFLYSDIHHVEIYVGAGLAISAPQEGDPVQFVHVKDFRSDFSGATRLA